MNSIKLLFLIFFMISMLWMTGCGNRQTVIFDQPAVAVPGYWEVAWVDPQIVASDTLYTLIRSQRIDSFYVDEQQDVSKLSAPALAFYVPPGGCFTVVNLMNDAGDLVRPLVARNLPGGHYKISCTLSRVNFRPSVTGTYYLKADYCGFPVTEQIGPR